MEKIVVDPDNLRHISHNELINATRVYDSNFKAYFKKGALYDET